MRAPNHREKMIGRSHPVLSVANQDPSAPLGHSRSRYGPRGCAPIFSSSHLGRVIPDLWFLTHEDLVAVEVLQQYACAPGASLRFTVEFYSQLFHSVVIAKTIDCTQPH